MRAPPFELGEQLEKNWKRKGKAKDYRSGRSDLSTPKIKVLDLVNPWGAPAQLSWY